jgi:hypothetical protein
MRLPFLECRITLTHPEKAKGPKGVDTFRAWNCENWFVLVKT